MIGRVGSYCGSLYFSQTDCWITDNAIAANAKLKNDPRFLFYLLTTLNLNSWRGGSGQPLLNQRILNAIETRSPNDDTQRAIAKILGDLDDKIDLLREMNRTLEETARAVYRAWFVDFEPVHAKAAGATSYRGMPQALFDQLPDSFSPSNIGDIPTGWKVEPLDEVAEFLNGLAMQKHRPADGEESLPVIKIAQLRKGSTEKSDLASANIPEKYKIQDGDFIFSWSGSLLAKFWTGGAGGLNQHLFKVTSDKFPIGIVACWVWHHLEEFQTIAASKATTMGHIKRGHLSEAKVLTPRPEQMESMSEILATLFDRQIANDLEARTLTDLRDTLLPKLISGELPAPDLEALGLTPTVPAEASDGG